MTSAINTNGLNVNYPVPGVNNNSQGFRDNFATIKTNLNTAGTEISDLQSKAVVKQALTGATVNNDMANTLISNALTRSFRASTYNLGNALSGTVLVNVSQGDVQYGAVTANTIIQFGGWGPAGTQSNVQLVLTFSNVDASIQFPSQVVNNGNYGAATLENYANGAGNVAIVTCPANSNLVDYRLSTLDCGNSITIEPYNRPRQSTQIQQGTPPVTGVPGDTLGTIAVDANYVYVCSGSYDSTAYVKTVSATDVSGNVTLNNTTSLAVNAPIVFKGDVVGGLVEGQVYYIKTIGSGGNITISDTRTGGVAGSQFALTIAEPANLLSSTTYIGTAIWKRLPLQSF